VSLHVCRASSRFLACILAQFCILAELRRCRRVRRRCSGDLWVVALTLACSVSNPGSNTLG
jgi:hypothetical protein